MSTNGYVCNKDLGLATVGGLKRDRDIPNKEINAWAAHVGSKLASVFIIAMARPLTLSPTLL